MKKIIAFFLIIFYHFALCQNIQVKYFENTFAKDPEKIKELPKNSQINFTPNLFSYTLTNNNNKSTYKNDKIILNSSDEIIKEVNVSENGDTITNNITSTAFDVKLKERFYFKNFSTNKVFTEFEINLKKYSIIDSLNRNNWVIKDDKEVILGYNCKKAVSEYLGYEYVAWFTEDIKINDGPQLYCGLPGLILKITTKQSEIIAYSVNLNAADENITQPVYSGKTYTFMELRKELSK